MAFKDYIKGKKLVGKKTNLKTTYKGKPVNRPVYINKDGEEYLNSHEHLNIIIK